MNPAPGVFSEENTIDGGLTFVCLAATHRHQRSMLVGPCPGAQFDRRRAGGSPLRVHPSRPGLDRAHGQFGVFRVTDLHKGEAARRHHVEVAARALPFEPQVDEAGRVELALPHRDAGADQGPHHAVAERVGLHHGDEHAVGVAPPAELLQGADRRGPGASLAVRSEVVQADEAGGRRIHRRGVQLVRVPRGAESLKRVVQGQAVGDAVLVAAPEGRVAGVETGGRPARPDDNDVGPVDEDAPQPVVQFSPQLERGGAHSDSLARAHEALGLLRGEVDVGDLPEGVHAGIRAPGNGQVGSGRIALEDAREPGLDLALHRAEARLDGPAGEVRAVVGDVEPHARAPRPVEGVAGRRKSHVGKFMGPAGLSLDAGFGPLFAMKSSHATAPGAASPRQPGKGKPARLAGLDGLRAIAVAAVVLYHFFPALLPGGFVGVDVFFVISGFLITGLFVAEHGRTGQVSLAAFWQRRVRRLVPPLVPLVLVCATMAWLIGGDVLVGLGRQVLGASTFSFNWVSIANHTSYFAAGAPELFRNLWSLAVEEQFYLVWPLLLLALLLIRAPRLRLALVGLLAVASAVLMGVLYQPGADPTRVYYGSDTHSFGLFAGAALALLLRRTHGEQGEFPRARPWLGLAALTGLLAAACWLHADGAVAYRGGLLGVSLLTAVVIWAGVRGGRFGSILDSTPLRYLGERSYGIYLWHWPVLVLIQVAWPATPGWQPWQTWLVGALAAALTLVAAGISYRWLEQPIRRLGLRGSIRILARLAYGSGARRQAVVAAAVVGLLLTAGTTAAIVSAPAASSAQSEIERGQRALDAAARAAKAKAAPARPIPGGDMITAVGDSVMLAAAPELQATFPGITIDAKVSRGMYSAPAILSSLARSGTLRPVVVVGLGTNGPITHADLASIQRAIGPRRELIMVNAFADRGWTRGVNHALATFSARNRLVELANWHDAIAPHADVLAGDRIHPGPTGGRIYAHCVGTALQRLADLPPMRIPGAARLLPHPV